MHTDHADGFTWGIADIEAALRLAARAPSIHNTQPWSWEFDGLMLSLRADRSRQLAVADPDGHSLVLSCGAALALTELGLAANGWAVQVDRQPDPADPDLLAHFRDPRPAAVGEREQDAAAAALRRRSDRRPFGTEPIADDIVEALRAAADGGGVHMHVPSRADEQINLAVAVSWADRVERHDADYLAEMARWLRDEEVHADGVPLSAVPRVDAEHPRRTDVPVRDFEVGVSGHELIVRDVDERPLIAVLLSEVDAAPGWLAAGEAMMRLMVEAEMRGVACCPLSQAVDLAAFRTRVQNVMGWVGHPQMMVRLGHPVTGDTVVPAPTPRRALSNMLRVTEKS